MNMVGIIMVMDLVIIITLIPNQQLEQFHQIIHLINIYYLLELGKVILIIYPVF